ncbi:unnamed protein product [Protopolystoma xenopodis]|uniref:Uncharacterized protein n=1 Tax=Protopolystoma xenopodis TaxID=117903 RepID=A0A448WU11_9PLAT|nr:unnamed protein product [Protopolystoma xenopodis]
MFPSAAKTFYYADLMANYLLFYCGSLAISLSIGGFMLQPPLAAKRLSYPYYHFTGIWLGSFVILLSALVPMGRHGVSYLRFIFIIGLFVNVILSAAIGMLLDELIVWFEMPIVTLMGSDNEFSAEDISVAQSFGRFFNMQQLRAKSMFTLAMIITCLIYYRLVAFGVVIYDDISMMTQQVIKPEEEKAYQDLLDQYNQSVEEGLFAGMSPTFDEIKSSGVHTLAHADKRTQTCCRTIGEDSSFEERHKIVQIQAGTVELMNRKLKDLFLLRWYGRRAALLTTGLVRRLLHVIPTGKVCIQES